MPEAGSGFAFSAGSSAGYGTDIAPSHAMPPTQFGPARTLSDIFGDGVSFSARPPFSGRYFMWPATATAVDARTGNFLSIAGTTTTVCARSVAGARGLALLEAAGVPSTAPLVLFDAESSYREILAAATRLGSRIAVQYLHPPDELSPATCWSDPDLHSFLNNKGNLGLLVHAEHTPQRTVVPLDQLEDLEALRPNRAQPLVLKGATDFDSGSGAAVVIARSPGDIRRARRRFEGFDAVVVEEFLALERNLCLCYATDGRTVEYHGYSDQLTDDQGVYQGNVLTPVVPAPPEAIAAGHHIMNEAVRRGYRGFAGFDMAILAGGRVAVMDLNFRLCASTPAVLWYGAICERAGAGLHARYCILRGRHPLGTLLPVALQAVAEGTFFPLSVFDPELSPEPDAAPVIRGLVLGDDREAVERNLAKLAEAGLVT